MSKYKIYNWDGKLIKSNIDDLKEAVREALKYKCEVCDKNGDIIFSQWDGWNGDYPNIKNICFPVADIEMINKAEKFLDNTNTFHKWCQLESNQFYEWIGKSEWLHSDRWGAVYDWVNDGKFADIDVPEDIIECLVEYWETNGLNIKFGI
jgi:hypothetical protein